MRSSTWRLEDLRNVILNLGFVGENLHTRQIFDCKKMFDQYPNASVSMTVTPPEGEPYPGTIERDGDLVIWDVRDSDLVADGDGEIQIVFTQEPHIARSYNAQTHICRSQVPTGSIPSGLDDYITRADQLLDQVEDTFPAGGTTGQVLAKKSNADYDTEWVNQGAGGTSDYDELENRPQIGGVTLTGNKTLHDLGAAAESDIPDPTSIIDDEAGAGDTDKVWSADKSHSLLTEIVNGNEQIIEIRDEIENYTEISLDASPTGWRLNESDGLCHSDANYQLKKYKVTAGTRIKVVSDDRFQFQTVATVPAQGASNKVGDVYGSGTFFVTVPDTATYLIASSPVSESQADAYTINSKIPAVDNALSKESENPVQNKVLSNILVSEHFTDLIVEAISSGWMVNNNGNAESKGDHKIFKYPVTPGDVLHLEIAKGYKYSATYQFQSNISVPSSNNPYIVGETVMDAVNANVTVPTGATYLMVSQSNSNPPQVVQKVTETDRLDDIEADITDVRGKSGKSEIIITSTGKAKTATGNLVSLDNVIDDISVSTTTPGNTVYLFGKNLIDFNNKTATGSGDDTLAVIVGRWISEKKYSRGVYVNDSQDHTAGDSRYTTCVVPVIPGVTYFLSCDATLSRYYVLDDEYNVVYGDADSSWKKNYVFTTPADSAYLVTSFSNEDATYICCGINGEIKKFTGMAVAEDGETVPVFSSGVIAFAANGESISISTTVEADKYVETERQINNARFVSSGSGTPLTLLHISDIHADKDSIGRIIAKAQRIASDIDDMICTGDIVANESGQIVSWWPTKMLTCIGNHDTATYNSSTGYDWTALSMADRDAYYIAPFESNWGITHTSGKSYYYKDYATQKVRLIVLDTMLYTDNGADATAQTAWLSDLLADAITNDLHVLLAVHGPHGGATSVDCSFSRKGNSTMPTYSDCNTPQSVVDAVATAITGGLKFIGYLCGHEHQDYVWDCENDGTQLMFSIGCASCSYVQWQNTDLYHSAEEDVINLVTIDTAHTLVKLIRYGGADFTNTMKTRKAICFNYSTGEIVGEVL